MKSSDLTCRSLSTAGSEISGSQGAALMCTDLLHVGTTASLIVLPKLSSALYLGLGVDVGVM